MSITRLLYQPVVWLWYIPFMALCTLVIGTLVILASKISPVWATRNLAPLWARLNTLAMPGWFRLHGEEHIDPQASYVVVANHLSQTDIFAIYGWLPLDLKWVIKKELRKVPIIGSGCAAMGHLFVDRKNRTEAQKALAAFKETIEPGTSVMFFPEGTRSSSGQLLPFKKGAFATAKDLGLPILPVTLVGTERMLPNHTFALLPSIADIQIQEPISLDLVEQLSATQLSDLARERIQRGLSDQGRQAESPLR